MTEPGTSPATEPKRDHALPGAELVEAGLKELADGLETAPALLVAAFSRRLKGLGYAVPDGGPEDPLLRLFQLLEEHRPDAHARYNALLRRMVSFAQAAECVR